MHAVLTALTTTAGCGNGIVIDGMVGYFFLARGAAVEPTDGDGSGSAAAAAASTLAAVLPAVNGGIEGMLPTGASAAACL